ncbi:hypothetical protein ACET9S_20040 [Aeromonas caviae]|uniref:hypothetical protein n=1 Tax=Aeromonas TaxID=642 RepID=UPI002485E390|nr:hypothetical protein [Aeromonas veronii]
MEFDPVIELANLRQRASLGRKQFYRRRTSRLDRYTAELLGLYQAEGSVAELQRWLRDQGVLVVHSTVARWLSKHTAKTNTAS